MGRIKSPFLSFPCMFQNGPNKEDQRRVKLFYSDVLSSKCWCRSYFVNLQIWNDYLGFYRLLYKVLVEPVWWLSYTGYTSKQQAWKLKICICFRIILSSEDHGWLMVEAGTPDMGHNSSALCWHWLMPDTSWSKNATPMSLNTLKKFLLNFFCETLRTFFSRLCHIGWNCCCYVLTN